VEPLAACVTAELGTVGRPPYCDPTAAVDARLDVDAALATLPPDYRAAVALRDLADLDYAEIAAVLRIPIGTVRSRIARGRATLADRIGNRDDPTERQTNRTP